MTAPAERLSLRPEPQPPGVYPGVPFDDYFAWPNVSKHQLDSLARSPAHYRAALEHPRKQTAAMTFGAAFHAAVLEPDKFTERYTQAPETDKRTKLGREAHEAAAAGGRVLLKIEELVAINEMVNAISSHPFASILLAPEDGEAEVSIAWVDEEIGVALPGPAGFPEPRAQRGGGPEDRPGREHGRIRSRLRELHLPPAGGFLPRWPGRREAAPRPVRLRRRRARAALGGGLL